MLNSSSTEDNDALKIKKRKLQKQKKGGDNFNETISCLQQISSAAAAKLADPVQPEIDKENEDTLFGKYVASTLLGTPMQE